MRAMPDADLTSLLNAETAEPAGPDIAALVEAARARHGDVAAALFYGSCLRSGDLDDKVADFYLLVDSYRAAHRSPLAAAGNAALPPNVYYLEVRHGYKTLRAKYAVLTLDDFDAATTRWLHPYIWARFAQPTRLAFWRDEASRARVVTGLANAIRKLCSETLPILPADFSSAAR